jgi:hypothetical protein
MIPAAALAYALSSQAHRDALNHSRLRPDEIYRQHMAARRRERR